MRQGIAENVFPGAVLLVSVAGRVVFEEAYGRANRFAQQRMLKHTLFDLASLTKPLATTPALILLVQGAKIALDQPVAEILPAFNTPEKQAILIRHLLLHNSGLPDYRTYYRQLMPLAASDRRRHLRALLVQEPLIAPIGKTVCYSDLGFMILAWVIETVTRRPLNRFVQEEIYRPLHLHHLFFRPLQSQNKGGAYAATENCAWRKCLLQGEVHDENAYAAGGVEGHAGLFGDARDVERLLTHLLNAYRGGPQAGPFEPRWVRRFLHRDDATERTLGFDTPSATGSSSGSFFSKTSVGHLGFTGTSFWLDLDREVSVVLLTNRIHPARSNERIRYFRPRLHDAVMQHLGFAN